MAEYWDWDDTITISSDDKNTILDEGDYDFSIRKFERGRTKEGKPKVMLTVEVGDPIDKKVNIIEHIALKDTMKWKIVQILESIGVLKEGEELNLTFKEMIDKMIGKEGRCHVYVDEYNKTKRNKIQEYLPQDADDFEF